MIKRALVSVSNKEGIEELSRQLAELDIEIVSTGGTASRLESSGIKVRSISDLTGFPEIMNGRVKTLHPKVHGGILAVRDNEEHQRAMKENNIQPIDLVVVNLYPFEETVLLGAEHAEVIENIDIGGPSMVRSAAKNYKHVIVVVDPMDYAQVVSELKDTSDISQEFRYYLMQKAFAHTAYYDSMIAKYMNRTNAFNDELSFGFKKIADMRYGENPHQAAAFYKEPFVEETNITNAEIIQGKQLSYNNIMDADAALRMVKEFTEPTAVVVKHANPAGIAVDESISVAFKRAFEADAKSAFGGIVALNRNCTKEIAEYLSKVFIEIVLAPDFEDEALDLFAKKKNVRVLRMGEIKTVDQLWDTKKVVGGILVQDMNKYQLQSDDIKVVTKTKPTDEQMRDLLFAWKVCKHVKSNAIVLADNNTTIGVGAGQMSRIDATKMALWKAGDQAGGSVLASDAYFPFRDTIDAVAPEGIKAIIQPGGSIRDSEVIDAADEHGIAMIFTEHRSFLH
ncbi:MAG: bifunctional phosphoribosylaminoimidazolecarboxamide formyltransferase/IMP cyclohydrolase [bacterium]|nr:bifunctional phosphoribosylaminoimidazolecarboxamide formyltransferase/IMP cyclohydrolase [bacterium]